MEITVNEKTLNNALRDGKSNEDIIMFLNQVIDEELEKENPDCDLIDDCINTIDEMQKDNCVAPALRLVLTCKNIKEIVNPKRRAWKQLNFAFRAAIVAAIIVSGTFTVNAAVEAITGVNVIEAIKNSVSSYMDTDENGTLSTEITVPVNESYIANEPTQATTEAESSSSHWHESTITQQEENEVRKISNKEESTTQNTVSEGEETKITQIVTEPTDPYTKPTAITLTGIKAVFDNFKTAYIFGEELTYDGLTIYARYSDNSEKLIPLSQCSYSKNLDMNVTADYTLSVTYKACTVRVNITVRPDEATRMSTICQSGDWDYLLNDNGAYITGYNGSDTDISVNEIDSNSIYAVTSKVFKDSNIVSFSSETVSLIYPQAFENCKSLLKCNTPNAISIGSNAFRGDESLRTIQFSDTLESLDSGAFESTAITELTIPKGISAVPERLCNNCQSLERVTLLGEVETVGDMAFNACVNLKEFNGAGKIKNVGDFAFSENGLMRLDVIPQLENVGDSAFAYCASIEFGEIGESFKALGVACFDNCEGITGVTIPSCVEIVPQACFNGVDLTSIVIENGVKQIKASAFRSNDSASIVIPQSVEYIGEYAFYSTKLRNVRIESQAAEIAQNAFYVSRRLTLQVYENSTAQDFAVQYSVKYEIIEEE